MAAPDPNSPTAKADEDGTWGPALALAGFGGMLPTLAKLASSYASNPNQPPPGVGVLIGILLFAIIGIGICYALGNKNTRQAIVTGIAAPGIISNILSGSAPISSEKATPAALQPRPGASLLLGSANAAPAQPANGPGKRVTFYVSASPEGLAAPAPYAEVQTNGGPFAYLADLPLSGPAVVFVPTDAGKLRISSGAAHADVTIPAASASMAVCVDLTIQPGLAGDVVWALGGRRTGQVSNVSANDCRIDTLVKEIADPSSKEVRLRAVGYLTRYYNTDPAVIDAVFRVIFPDDEAIAREPSQGRINGLVVLSLMAPEAWAPDTVKRAEHVIAQLESLQQSGKTLVGIQSQERMQTLKSRLNEVRQLRGFA